MSLLFFFFIDTSTTEIYSLSLHDALPIYWSLSESVAIRCSTGKSPRSPSVYFARSRCYSEGFGLSVLCCVRQIPDRKSTRLNSSHANISYAVFCLKKKTYKQ